MKFSVTLKCLLLILLPAPAIAQAKSEPVELLPTIEYHPEVLKTVPKRAETQAIPAGTEEFTAVRLSFQDESTILNSDAIAALTGLAADLVNNAKRIRLVSYALITGIASDSNRLALNRAIAIRDFLVGQGIADTRTLIEIGKAESPDLENQVDILPVDQ